MSDKIEPRRASWRMLATGSTVWAPVSEHEYLPGIVTGLGKNRGDNTVVHLHLETGGKGRRLAGERWWQTCHLPHAISDELPRRRRREKPRRWMLEFRLRDRRN
jgi:hypothetical protein